MGKLCAMLFLIATVSPSTTHGQMPDTDSQSLTPRNEHPEIVLKPKSNTVPIDTALNKEIARRLSVANFYFVHGNYKASEALFRNILETKPNSAEAMFGLAESQEKLGKTEDARHAYEMCLKIAPDSPYAGLSRTALKNLEEQNPR